MTKEEALRGLPKGARGIQLRDKETVTLTDKHPAVIARKRKAGSKMDIHPELVKHFAEQGFIESGESKKK